MAKTMAEWFETEVAEVRSKPLRWISEQYFFRDPNRPVYTDPSYFFAPADGIVLYACSVQPDEAVVDIKGKPYSLKDALRDDDYDHESVVVGIFMTFYDVHINRIPYAGRLSYRELDPIDTDNYPMIEVEHDMLRECKPYIDKAGYLFNNQRVVNRVFSIDLWQSYYILQIADYDVDSITPFTLKQHQSFSQNQRFSQIRYGSQVDLIIPKSDQYEFTPVIESHMHVEAGLDPVVRVTAKRLRTN